MRRIKIIIAVFTAAFFTSCSSEGEQQKSTETTEKEFVIEGEVTNGDGQMLRLYSYMGEEPKVLDSAKVENGKVQVKAPVEGYTFYGLGKSPTEIATIISDGNDEIKVFINYNDIAYDSKVEGSVDSKLMNDFSKRHKSFFDEMTIYRDSLAGLSYNENQKRDSIIELANVLKTEFKQFIYDFIDQNPESPAIYMTSGELNDPTNDIDYLRKIEKTIATTMPNSIYHDAINSRILQSEQLAAQMKEQEEMMKKQQEIMAAGGIAIGSPAPDLAYPDPSGIERKLSDLKGKVVLLDFWASWCKPCRMENPNVVRLYNKYKEKGFTVFSVSLDDNGDRWKAAIQQDGLIWPTHVSDLKGWQSQPAQFYKVNSIPQTFLIGKDGNIIAIGLRGAQLEQKLHELLD